MYRIKFECRYKSYIWLLFCLRLWRAVTVDFSYCRCSLWGLLLRASKWSLLVLISSTIALQTGYYLAFWIYVRFFFFWYDPLRQSIECLEVGIFTCREGSEFSPVIGFFVDLSPSEVRAIRLFVYIFSWQLALLLSYFDWNSFCCINSISFNVAHLVRKKL